MKLLLPALLVLSACAHRRLGAELDIVRYRSVFPKEAENLRCETAQDPRWIDCSYTLKLPNKYEFKQLRALRPTSPNDPICFSPVPSDDSFTCLADPSFNWHNELNKGTKGAQPIR